MDIIIVSMTSIIKNVNDNDKMTKKPHQIYHRYDTSVSELITCKHGYNVHRGDTGWNTTSVYRLCRTYEATKRGNPSDESAKTEVPCSNMCGTIKIPFCSMIICVKQIPSPVPLILKCWFCFFWYYVLLTHTNPVHVLIKGNDSTYMYQWSFKL